jgi:hypothetical protein
VVAVQAVTNLAAVTVVSLWSISLCYGNE